LDAQGDAHSAANQPSVAAAPDSKAPSDSQAAAPAASTTTEQRTRLNLLGQTDAQAGESRRNENIQFNLVDNNLLRELNTRLGTTATIVTEFRPERGYFGAEYGNQPASPIHVSSSTRRGVHGRFFESHLNSVFSARSFFQVGSVKPARENNYGADFLAPLWKNATLSLTGNQQKVRGMVNGNILVPLASERTPLAADTQLAAYVQRILSAFPAEQPNRTDINKRMLNTNAPQEINSSTSGARIDQILNSRDRLVLRYQWVHQRVLAFQFVKGQNPDTTTRSHQGRLTWLRQLSPATALNVSLGFDRVVSQLVPDNNNIGAMFTISGLTTVGPNQDLPIDRAENMYRPALQVRHTHGIHEITAGFDITRRYLNGIQNDSKLGSAYFQNDQGRDGITNLRMGLPNRIFVSIGESYRRFRNWDQSYYAGDRIRATSTVTVSIGLRYQPVALASEAGGLIEFPYRGDWNNFAPMAGIARRLGGGWGVLRAAYALAYDTVPFATYQQLRFNPPYNQKLVIYNPDLLDPIGTYLSAPQGTQRTSLYRLDSNLVAPYSHQYNASWEPAPLGAWRIQLGYTGSRTPKIIQMWYVNRARIVPGVPLTTATIDERRPDSQLSEVKHILNASFAWYDAARVTLVAPAFRGLSIDASYWFSKALDLGANYVDTSSNRNVHRGQSEFDSHKDLKGLSDFDQPHSFLARVAYQTPAARRLPRCLLQLVGTWTLSSVVLLKSGTPFLVQSGSDSPGYGNVDGASYDRVNILDPSILGRTIGNPDNSQALLPRSAFSYIQPGELAGNIGRNVFRKGPIYNVNASVSRRFSLAREKTLQFRAESVNLTNTAQFAAPGSSLTNPEFGMITNTLNDGRTIRFQISLDY
jgi:hypothetical protein